MQTDGIHGFSSTLSDEDLLLSFISLAELSDDGVLIVDAGGRIAYINTAYCDYLGLDKQNLMGERYSTISKALSWSKLQTIQISRRKSTYFIRHQLSSLPTGNATRS